jgi:hypothetical protein
MHQYKKKQFLVKKIQICTEIFTAIIRCGSCDHIPDTIQGVPGGKVNILGGHSIGHSKQNIIYTYTCPIPNGFRDRAISLYSTDEQHVMSSHELRSALLLTVELLKMYYTT